MPGTTTAPDGATERWERIETRVGAIEQEMDRLTRSIARDTARVRELEHERDQLHARAWRIERGAGRP